MPKLGSYDVENWSFYGKTEIAGTWTTVLQVTQPKKASGSAVI